MTATMTHFIRTLAVAALLAGLGSAAHAQVTMDFFQQDFDQLPLAPPEEEQIFFPEAFTHQVPPPLGGPNNVWRRNDSGVPEGVFEWEGWSFANKDFWLQIANDDPGDGRRAEFTRGEGTILVADPNEWNDDGNPANNAGFYNTFLQTPQFSISELREKGPRHQFKVDSSWIPQCCDDGLNLPDLHRLNNKTATIVARFNDGSTQELLRWESARSFDKIDGRPLPDNSGDLNPFFKPAATNELLYVDLSPLLLTSHFSFSLEFGLTNAGDDWWWAMDNMQIISMGSEVLGDMDLSGKVEEADIAHFAQAMHNEFDYIINHFGESPAVRGSLDPTFDFDDIDWFVELLNNEGIAATQATVIAAINAYGVPEPASGVLAMCFVLTVLGRRHNPC